MLYAIILAAGDGKRFKSKTSKIFHKIMGKEIVNYVIDSSKITQNQKTIIVSSKENYQNHIITDDIKITIQENKLGTADALKSAIESILKENNDTNISNDDVMVLCGDSPLIKKETLKSMYESYKNMRKKNIHLACFESENPNNYGRCIVEDEFINEVVEAKDATPEQLKIKICNSGIYIAPINLLNDLINSIDNKNNQQEFYLTDIVKLAKQINIKTKYFNISEEESLGINTRSDFSKANNIMNKRIIKKHQESGVTFLDTSSVHLFHDTIIERDVIIHPNVVIGKGVIIEEGAEIFSFSHLEDTKIGFNAEVGPFARLRGNCVLEEYSQIGNFVEAKNTLMKKKSKAKHLSYLGDSTIGNSTNIGAGTITCNYDGKNKHKTTIGDNSFIGSNTSIIAPINIGSSSLIGAGSVITNDVPDNSLSISRPKQETKERKIIKNTKKAT